MRGESWGSNGAQPGSQGCGTPIELLHVNVFRRDAGWEGPFESVEEAG